MKKVLLTLAAVLTIFGASAKVETTQFYSEDFVKMGADNDIPAEGWLTYGNGAKPEGEIPQDFFGEKAGGSSYILINAGGKCYALANTVFEGGVAADEWLVSPEIEMPYDDAVINFDAIGYAAQGVLNPGKCPIEVYVSDSGAEKADFKTVVTNKVNVSSSASTEIVTKTVAVPVNGFKGKKVRFAFVVKGQNVGFCGVTNIGLSQYAATVTSFTETIVEAGSKVTIDYNFGLRAPVQCSQIKAQLYINDELAKEETYKKQIGSATSLTMAYQRMKFENVATVEEGKNINYRIVVTPDFAGALPTTVTGTVGVARIKYVGNVVVEELTATGCGWCPRGIAALEYYSDNYPGTETEGKAINIGAHSYMNHYDPMIEGVEQYVNNLAGIAGTGLPNCSFNRTYFGDPSSLTAFNSALEAPCYNKAKITGLILPELAEGETMEGKEVKVRFEVRNAFTTEGRALNGSVVLIENDVNGYNSDYSQENYFYNQTESLVLANWAHLKDYLKPYLPGGKYGVSEIKYSDITYQHVARGNYPSFDGELLAEVWEEDVPRTFEIPIKIGANVNNFENTEIIVLVTDPISKAVVASDIVSYSDYATLDVEEIEISENGVAPVYYNLNGVRVAADNLVKGVYLEVRGDKTRKIFVK